MQDHADLKNLNPSQIRDSSSLDGSDKTFEVPQAMKRIAVLMATHDRPKVTEAAVARLILACAEANLELRLFVTSSARNDHTVVRVLRLLPNATVIRVHERSFWAESMRTAWEHARESVWDYLLWLNDDAMLFEQGLLALRKTVDFGPQRIIAVGSFCEPDSRKLSYGLAKRGPWFRPFALTKVVPNGTEMSGEVANGNALLMTRISAKELGGFPRGYKHNQADIAFSFQASRQGYLLRTPRDFVGFCRTNPDWNRWAQSNSLATLISGLFGVKGMPVTTWIPFALRYGGAFGLVYAFSPYLTHTCRGLLRWLRQIVFGKDPSRAKGLF